MTTVSEEDVQQIAVDLVRKRKNPKSVDVSYVQEKDGVWIVQGTCPIDLEGHPWTERFEVVVDRKGKVTSSYFSLL